MSLLRKSLLAVALAAAGVVASATTVVPPDFTELVKGSDYVVRGTVRNISYTVRQVEGRDVPHTLVTVEVAEVMAGTPPASVVLDMVGGPFPDGRVLVIDGVPQFKVGDESVFFVQGNGTNFYPLYAVMHGLYPVKQDKTTGRRYMTRANGVPLSATAEVSLPLSEGKMAQVLRRQISTADALSVDEFRQSIRTARENTTPTGVVHAN